MKKAYLIAIILGFGGASWGQYEGATVDSTKGLPSTQAPLSLPEVESTELKANVPEMDPSPTTSIPQPRPPAADLNKTKTQDWGQDMQALQEAGKKKQAEMAGAEEQQAKEAQEKRDFEATEKKEKAELKKESDGMTAPAVSQSSLPGVKSESANKLSPVTGLDGVQPRGMSSGDGRVSPNFDSFTGPQGSGPLGKDFQSGARPIMPPGGSYDSRLNAAGQAPEVPSGAYKQISQDPYSVPPGSDKKVVAQVKPNPLANPPAPKKTVGAIPSAGYSPYDNNFNVPNPRTPPRF